MGGLLGGLAALNPVAFAGNMAAGGLSYLGQKDTNATNVKNVNATNAANERIAAAANATNVKLAEEYRNWQTQMSNTAYQRQTQDMIAAGINPMLAAVKGGGADSPGGSPATVNPVTLAAPVVQNELDYLGRGISSATSMVQQQQDIETRKADAATRKMDADTHRLAVENLREQQVGEIALMASQIKQREVEMDVARQRMEQMLVDMALSRAQAQLATASAREAAERTKYIGADWQKQLGLLIKDVQEFVRDEWRKHPNNGRMSLTSLLAAGAGNFFGGPSSAKGIEIKVPHVWEPPRFGRRGATGTWEKRKSDIPVMINGQVR